MSNMQAFLSTQDEMTQIKYRPGEQDDLNEICTMVAHAVETMISQNIFQWDDMYPAKEHLIEDIDKKQLYVGMLDGKIAVIYVINQEYDDAYQSANWRYKEEPFYIIHRLCVNPIFQNKGIARKTLLHIEKELRAMGIQAIRLDVFSQNPYALRLYENLGYEKTGDADWRKGRFYLLEKHI